MYQQQLMHDTQQIFDFYCDAIASDLHNIIVDVVAEALKDKERSKTYKTSLQRELAVVLDKLNHKLNTHYQAVMGRKMQDGKLQSLKIDG